MVQGGQCVEFDKKTIPELGSFPFSIVLFTSCLIRRLSDASISRPRVRGDNKQNNVEIQTKSLQELIKKHPDKIGMFTKTPIIITDQVRVC